MKAALLTAKKEVRIDDLPRPEAGPGEVLIRVAHVGICGSDVHYWRDGRIGDAIIPFPFPVGHEAAGVVEALGPGAEGFAPGNPVAIEPGISCLRCEPCRRGLPHLCPNVRFLGTPPVRGAFCDFIVLPPRNLLRIPEGVSLEQASMMEPLGVAVHAVNLSTVKPGESALVVGCGPIGLLTLQVLRAAGAHPLVATDLLPYRVEAARASGADLAIDARDGKAVARIREAVGGIAHVFEACGDPKGIEDAIRAAAPGADFIVIGIPGPGPTPFEFHDARRRELRLTFSRRSNQELEQCLRLVEKKLVDLAPLVTHRVPLERIGDAFALVDRYADGVIKAMVEIG
ncbi:MAG: alcohol dehydrogenase catalytic domain-containing protein [Planctomycetes bacterium]|nr:alcohol dehydrogenase catalytic domain-containing protein [Planctomycetota bacterium]